MKTFLKPCIKILVLLFAFTLFNCEKDDEFIPEKVVTQNFKITKINESDLNLNLLSKLENINKKSKAFDRLITSENHDFIISTNSGSYLETIDGLYHSYTFPIIRNSESDFLENIMFSKHIDEDYKIKLITYEVSSEEKEILKNGGVVDLEGKVSTQEINDDNLTSDVFSRTVDCVTIVLTTCSFGNHAYGMLDGAPCPGYTENTIFDNCGGGSGGGTTGGNSDDIDPTDLGNNNNTNNGGGVNNNYNGVDFSNPTFNTAAEQLAYILNMQLDELINEVGIWINKKENEDVVQQITNYILNECQINPSSCEEAKSFADRVLEAQNENLTSSYTELDYPGKDLGFEYEWWLDNIFVENNFSFELDEEGFGDLTAQEKLLVIAFPAQALSIKANKEPAETETYARFGTNGLNDKSDAFRHAFFNAMNSNDVGFPIAKLFSDAHESEVPTALIKEKQMDLYNNDIGLDIGFYASALDSDTYLSDSVFTELTNGNLLYLFPIDFISSPRYDLNGDGIQDCSTCLNGITSSTSLIATNLP